MSRSDRLFDDQKTASYMGKISWSRVSGQAVLFDSDFTHQHFISLKIYTAKMSRGLNETWVLEGNMLIEVYLSAAQFTEFLTHPNTSSVPCTLGYVAPGGDGPVDAPTLDPEIKKFDAELSEDMQDAYNMLDSLRAQVDTMMGMKSITKASMRVLNNDFNRLDRHFRSNMPFLFEQLGRTLRKHITRAKVEVESYITHRVQRAGLKALGIEESGEDQRVITWESDSSE